MPHRGSARHCSWHSFWSSPIASGTRARAGPACDLFLSLLRVSPRRVASRHVTSCDLVVYAASAYAFPGRHGAPARSIPTGKRGDTEIFFLEEKMQLTTCCRCCSLKTGTIFSGVCGIVLAVIALILIFTANVEWKTIIIDILDKTTVKVIFAINLCMTILISTLLIIGALRKNTFMMLPWVVLGIMLAVALLVSILYTAIMFFVNSEVLNGVLWLVFGLIAVVVYTYMWLVVYSYFQQLKIEKMSKRMGPYGKPYNYRRA